MTYRYLKQTLRFDSKYVAEHAMYVIVPGVVYVVTAWHPGNSTTDQLRVVSTRLSEEGAAKHIRNG